MRFMVAKATRHPDTARTMGDSVSRRIRAGWALSGLGVLFLLFDATIKLRPIPPVVASFDQLGFPVSASLGLAVLEFVLLALYLAPRTSMLGALLFTGFLGGATAIQVRVGNPFLTHVLFPSYVAALLWGGLFLRDDRVRVLVPAPRVP